MLVLALSSCTTLKPLPVLEKGEAQTAIVRWNRDGNSLILDAVFTRTPSGVTAVSLSKQSAYPLLEIRALPNGKVIAGGPMSGGFRNPAQLAGWTSFLLAYQQSSRLSEGNQELHTAQFRAAYEKQGKALKVLSVSSQDTGETITARFRD